MGRKINIANPNGRDLWRHSYLLWFGAYGDTLVLAYANSLDDALDEAADWLADNAPGLFIDDAVEEAYQEAIARGLSEEEAIEEAEVDVTRAGNEGRCLASWEWGIVAEDPSKAQLIAIARGR